MSTATDTTKFIAFNIDKNASIKTLQSQLAEAVFWADQRGLTTPRLHSIGSGKDTEGNDQHSFAFLADTKNVETLEDVTRLLKAGLAPSQIIERMEAQAD